MRLRYKNLLVLLLSVGLMSCALLEPQSEELPEHFFDQAAHPKERGYSRKSYLVGIFNPDQHPDMQKVESRYASKELYLHKDTLGAFKRMHAAAARDGIQLRIVSGLRTFDYQRYIWDRKWKSISDKSNHPPLDVAKTVLTYSAMPTTSRHHWGSDIDLNALENEWFEYGEGKKIYTWLKANAASYGFCQVYSANIPGQLPRPGYHEERWHWSYMPLAATLLDFYEQEVADEQIRGFAGDDTPTLVRDLRIRDNYINGIASDCRRMIASRP